MNTMRNFFILLVILFSTNALATKVAVVEVQKVFEQSIQAQALKKELEKEFAPRQKVLQGKQAELELKVRNYEKNRQTYSEKEVRESEQEIFKLRQEFQKYGQKLQAEFQKDQQKNVRVIESVIEDYVSQIAKKEGYDLVLFQGIAYYKKSLNITEKVIQAINKKAKKK